MKNVLNIVTLVAVLSLPTAAFSEEDFIRKCGLFYSTCDETTKQWQAIDGNTQAIDGNTQAIDRNTQAIADMDNRLNSRGIASMAALSSIDFVDNVPQIGVGVGYWDSEFGYAVKGMIPLSEKVHGTLGVFGSSSDYGTAASVVFKF